MNLTPLKTKRYLRTALGDERLRNAVSKATATAVNSSVKITADNPLWEHLRLKTHSIKKEVMDHLDVYLVEFEENCRANGIRVHWAADAAEAREIVVNIAEENEVKKIVKSKSLTSEEVQLNEILEKREYETVETDLGEYIVQLMDQIPSHLTMPALHLGRKDIGKLFQEKLGINYTEEPEELLRVAREKLREHFLSADMGISGANFAIACNGSFCVIENEANAHLTLTLPRVHVALLGIEKLLPDMQSLAYFLKVLAPRATGQKATTYVNIVGGPGSDKYKEGPEQVHVILLDNGRSQMLKDPKLRETLFCIRCGACLNICPIYNKVGGHAYGWVYMGPIGSTLIPQYLGEEVGRYAPFLSSLCGACFDFCPMRIQIPHHLLTLRNRVVESKRTKKIESIAMSVWAYLMRRPRLYRFFTFFPGKLQLLLPKGTAFPVPGYTKKRSFVPFDTKGFRKRYVAMRKNKTSQ